MTQEGGVPRDFWGRIEKMIADAVAKLARSGMLRNARISGGSGLTIADGGKLYVEYPADLGGGVMAYFGRIVAVADGTYMGTGMLLQAPDGTDMMSIRTDASFGTTMHNIYDSGGRIIFGNDASSGQGIARPWVPFVAYPSDSGDWPTTTSTSFVTKHRARGVKMHPRLYVETWAYAPDAGAVAEVQVLVNGAVWGAPKLSSAGFVSGLTFGPLPVAGDHMSTLEISVQYRLASGTGLVQCGIGRIEGRQS